MGKTGKRRTRKVRRQAKQVIKHGAGAKRVHKAIGGRKGSIHHKRLKSLLQMSETTE